MNLVQAERGGLAIVVVYSVAIGLLSLALPVAVQALVNTVAFGTVLQPIVVLTALVTVALAASALLSVLRSVVLERVQQRIFARQASEVLDSLLRFRAEAVDSERAPELVNRFLEVATVQKSAATLAVDGLNVLVQTSVGVLLLAAYHPYLLVFDLFLVVSILLVVVLLGRGAVRSSIDESRSKYEVLAWLEEVARHSATLRSRTGAQMAVERANHLVLEYLNNRGRHFRVLLRQIIGTQVIQAVALSSLLGVGGYLVISGELTLGQLVAAELVVSLAVGSFAKFGKSLEVFYDLQAALDKLSHLTDLPLESGVVAGRTPGPGNPAPASLKVSGLTFGYEGSSPILADVALTVPRGGRVALHGRNAAGKSTLLDLIFRLREPHQGILELDGMDYRHVSLEDLRSDLMLVRGTETFPGTVAENVMLGKKVRPEEIRDALAKAGVLDAVLALPHGWDTVLTPSGRPLASSHALRLTFARAILHRPRLLLVDEALDAIDDLRADGVLVHTLFDPQAPWTLIAATERPELWPLFDRVYGLRAGTLQTETSTGTHRE
jgi:ABC-type bacteriocin/lantibiotic exporter with double-glycine peptidase domain